MRAGLRFVLRQQKNAAHQSTPGQYDKSFEKVVERIDHSLPRNKISAEMSSAFNEKDQWFGDVPYAEQKRQTQQDLWGKEGPTLTDQRRTMLFHQGDWVEHVNDALEKAKKIRSQQPPMDPKVLKTTKEPSDYYYKHVSLEQKVLHRRKVLVVSGIVAVLLCVWLWRLLEAARTD